MALSTTPSTTPSTTLSTALITEPHLESPDAFYEALIETHRDLSEPQSHALNARLVLLLANHIGSQAVLLAALAAARAAGRAADDTAAPTEKA